MTETDTPRRRAGVEELRAQLRALIDRMDRERAAGLLRLLQPPQRPGRTGEAPYWLSSRTRKRRKQRDQEIAQRAQDHEPQAAAMVALRRFRQAIYRAQGDAEAVAQLVAERDEFKRQREQLGDAEAVAQLEAQRQARQEADHAGE